MWVLFLLIQRSKLKCSEGWKAINEEQQSKGSQQSDIRPPLRTPWVPPVSKALGKGVRLETGP